MASCIGLLEKSVPFVAATFSISYPSSRAAWNTTYSYDSRVSVIASNFQPTSWPYGFARYQIKLSRQKFSRSMFCKWRNDIFRSIKHNPEWNATIIITRFFSIFLTASRIVSLPPCFCILHFHHSSNARKKNIQCAHCPLKPFLSFFSGVIYFLWLKFQCILPWQHTLETSLSMEKLQTISKNFLWGYCVIHSPLSFVHC